MDLVSPQNLTPTASLVYLALVGFFTVAFPLLLVVRAFQARWRARVLRRAVANPDAPLAAGYAFVQGRVAADGDDPCVAEAAITQVAKNHSTSRKGKWHTWEETSRTSKVAPFTVVHASGETIRVEPERGSDAPWLVDELDVTQQVSPATRKRVCRILDGERVTVDGELRWTGPPRGLQAGYREAGASGWTLSPRRGERMTISVEPVSDRLDRRARLLGRAASIALLLVGLSYFLAFRTYVTALYAGAPLSLTVQQKVEWKSRNKNGATTHRGIVVGVPTSRGVEPVQFELKDMAYELVGVGDSVPAFGVRGSTAVYLGDRPSLSFVGAALHLFGLVCALVVFVAHSHSRMRWYERRSLSEHGGAGWIS